MSAQSIEMYISDNSGPFHKPHPDSNVEPHKRIEFLTHENLLKGLSGPGLTPTFTALLRDALSNLDIDQELAHISSLMQFFKDHITPPISKALFGLTLLSVNPTLIEDLWTYDRVMPDLAKRLPKF
ncbi:MAG: hypothetical protein MMC33_008085 [Icmadophila ericetorum]|nr:hypothetical protein [Icmadophila ericetorum]